jgi:hypothetical protein
MGTALLILMAGKRGTVSQRTPRAGDVIVAREHPSPVQWGLRERKSAWLAAGRPAGAWPGSFGLIFVPDLTFDKDLAAELCSGKTKPVVGDPDDHEVEFLHRWRIDLASGALVDLASDGEVVLAKSELASVLVNKVDPAITLADAHPGHPKFITNRGPHE